MKYVLLIVALLGLVAFTAYQIVTFVAYVKERKSQNRSSSRVENEEKGI